MSSVKHHIQFVRLGFGDLFGLPGHSLEFTTDKLDTKTAQEVVKEGPLTGLMTHDTSVSMIDCMGGGD